MAKCDLDFFLLQVFFLFGNTFTAINVNFLVKWQLYVLMMETVAYYNSHKLFLKCHLAAGASSGLVLI